MGIFFFCSSFSIKEPQQYGQILNCISMHIIYQQFNVPLSVLLMTFWQNNDPLLLSVKEEGV